MAQCPLRWQLWQLPIFDTCFLAQSVARALVLLRVRGQMERQWGHQPRGLPEGQVQRMFSGHGVY